MNLLEGLPEREQPTAAYLRLRGRALRAAGRVFDAEAAFREAMEIQPADAALLADLATTLLGQKRHVEAHGLAVEACALRPEVAAFHCLRGVLADALERPSEAGEAYALARALAPEDAESHAMHAWHLLRAGELDAADAAFRVALSVQPGHAEALRGLARVRLERGDWEGARRGWLEALALEPRLRDGLLQRALLVGRPELRPVRALAGVSRGVSLALAGVSLVVLVAFATAPGGVLLGVSFLALAAGPPLARLGLRTPPTVSARP